MTLRNNLIKYIIEPKLELPLKANRKHKTILAIGDSWTSENILYQSYAVEGGFKPLLQNSCGGTQVVK